MFIDPSRAAAFQQLREHDLRPFARLLTLEVLLQAAAQCGLRVVACPLNVLSLVWLALAAALRPKQTFTTLLTATLQLLRDQEGFAQTPLGRRAAACRPRRGKHTPRSATVVTVTEEAFVKARRRLPQEFWPALMGLLTDRFQTRYADLLRYRHFRLLAVDGTRLTVPDWPALRQAFGTANNSSGRHAAQARLVLLQCPTVRLPYRYALSELAVGEPTLARRLVKHLHADDLLLMDAGYCSYGLLSDIRQRQAFFLLRVSRPLNVRRVAALGAGDTLVRWTPKDSRGQWRREGLPRSMLVRRLVYRRPGYRPLQLLTNVLAPAQLPWAEVSALVHAKARGLSWCVGVYHQRWQIETGMAELKVVQQLEGGLRSRTADGIRFEVGGHLVLYLLVRWLLVEAGQAAGVSALRLSYRSALDEVQRMTETMLLASARWREQTLYPRLLERLASHQVPERPGRNYPRTKKKQRHSKKKPVKG